MLLRIVKRRILTLRNCELFVRVLQQLLLLHAIVDAIDRRDLHPSIVSLQSCLDSSVFLSYKAVKAIPQGKELSERAFHNTITYIASKSVFPRNLCRSKTSMADLEVLNL